MEALRSHNLYVMHRLLAKRHILFQLAQLCLPNATYSFKQCGSTFQKPRSISEKMSKATFCFKGPDVCAGRFFSREEIRGFWLRA
ncbi:hypothetical protein HMPREF9069_00397 [Atopobium sp. oral taxon 810 str. F0209]|nr:hypothetical protein HMPREF9069_00397 [Atopobium sp. oral taxon 810 str. F0209]